MAWFLNRYLCEACGESWEDQWSCACDDKCPTCGKAFSPEDSEDMTVTVVDCEVGVSPASAEDSPAYDWRTFPTPEKAEKFGARVRRLIDAGRLPSFDAFKMMRAA